MLQIVGFQLVELRSSYTLVPFLLTQYCYLVIKAEPPFEASQLVNAVLPC